MNTSMISITPTMAERWLDKVPDYQRKIDPKQVKKLVIAIQRKEWRENGATIAFNENDEVIDGQHRLKAIVESGITVNSLVVRGIGGGEDTFQTLGDSKPRKLQDFMRCANVNVVSSVMRMYWQLTTGVWPIGHGGQAPPIPDVMKLAKKWSPEVSDMVQPLAAAGRILGQSSFCVFLVFYFTKIRPIENAERISEFFARVGDGLGLTSTCPVYKLRQRFTTLSGGSKIDRTSAQALILKAMYMYLDGKACANLVFNPAREAFPELRGFRK